MENLKNSFAELKSVIAEFEEQFNTFVEKENKAAGVRARKGLQSIKKSAQVVRLNIIDALKAMPVKTRKKSEKTE